MAGEQVLIPVSSEDFWKRMRTIVEEVLLKKQSAEEGVAAAPKLLKAKEVCELFQISKPTLYEWMQKGQLTSVKIGSRRFFLASDVGEAIRKSRTSSGPQDAHIGN